MSKKEAPYRYTTVINIKIMLGKMTNEITIVYPLIKESSGTKSYVENTLNGLSNIGINFDKIEIKKREISLNGKP